MIYTQQPFPLLLRINSCPPIRRFSSGYRLRKISEYSQIVGNIALSFFSDIILYLADTWLFVQGLNNSDYFSRLHLFQTGSAVIYHLEQKS